MSYQPWNRSRFEQWHKARCFDLRGSLSSTPEAFSDRRELYRLLRRTDDIALQINREEVVCRRFDRDSSRRHQLIADLETAMGVYDQQVVMFNLMHG